MSDLHVGLGDAKHTVEVGITPGVSVFRNLESQDDNDSFFKGHLRKPRKCISQRRLFESSRDLAESPPNNGVMVSRGGNGSGEW